VLSGSGFLLFLVAVVLAAVTSASAQDSEHSVAERLTALEKAVQDLGSHFEQIGPLLQRLLPPSPIERVSPFNHPTDGAHSQGATTAPLALIEFADFECPFCGQYTEVVYPQLKRRFVDSGQLLYVFRHMPLEALHPSAREVAQIAECAGGQGAFWLMHDLIFADQSGLARPELLRRADTAGIDVDGLSNCLEDGRATDVIERDLTYASDLGLTGTPAFLLGRLRSDGSVAVVYRIVGAQPLSTFLNAIESLLAPEP
jgi:protein-disulfide isomerase